jgi:hypothetical protein
VEKEARVKESESRVQETGKEKRKIMTRNQE